MAEFVMRGSRGSLPVSGREFLRHGGRTTCLSVSTGTGHLIIDAGTGISHVAEYISAAPHLPITLAFTHLHNDHTMGFTNFAPFYNKKERIEIIADPGRDEDWRQALDTIFAPPYWPLTMRQVQAQVERHDLPVVPGEIERYGINVRWFRVPHPQQSLTFRLEADGRSVVFATDVEYEVGMIDQSFIEFIRGADVLIHDSHYLPEEYPAHRNWGHSTWEVACEAANRAEIPRLLLTHHAPERDDDGIDRIIEAASGRHHAVEAAIENTRI